MQYVGVFKLRSINRRHHYQYPIYLTWIYLYLIIHEQNEKFK